MGDLNAHHPLWGGGRGRACRNGNAIVSALDQSHGIVLNPSPPSLPIYTYFPTPPRQPSVLDIAIVSPTLGPIGEFTQKIDMRGSDHTPIKVILGLKVTKIKFFSHKLKLTPTQRELLETAIDGSDR